MTLTTVNTPALTTATACNSALTGVGATMAAGSQRCIGISAALPMPYMYRMNRVPSTGAPMSPLASALVNTPPCLNASSPVYA